MALTKRDFETIKQILQLELGKFITKDDFYKTIDKVMSELSDLREEVTLSASHAQISDLEERAEALEKIHPQGTHSSLF
ncbi:MAG: hypothetical protein AAB856_02120 [Patescibacteria group bacterium]